MNEIKRYAVAATPGRSTPWTAIGLGIVGLGLLSLAAAIVGGIIAMQPKPPTPTPDVEATAQIARAATAQAEGLAAEAIQATKQANARATAEAAVKATANAHATAEAAIEATANTQSTKVASTMPANPLERNGMYSSPPEMQIDTDKIYHATIETNKGIIELELYPQYAPKTVNNFVFLAQEGYYDNLTFHRVIADFMIQGGDPSGSGGGGPGYNFEDEVGSDNPLTHETGVISMANSGPNTNGSQFFITHSPQPHLNGMHTVFGKVTNGQDIVNAIQQGDTMLRIEITEIGD